MQKTITYAALGAVLLLAGSCEKDDSQVYNLQQSCEPAAKVVKTITNAEGLVSFNQDLQQYQVAVHQPGTIDVVDVGIVCGTLPPALQNGVVNVVVSGTFKEYKPAPSLPVFVGYTYYYLEVSSIRLR